VWPCCRVEKEWRSMERTPSPLGMQPGGIRCRVCCDRQRLRDCRDRRKQQRVSKITISTDAHAAIKRMQTLEFGPGQIFALQEFWQKLTVRWTSNGVLPMRKLKAIRKRVNRQKLLQINHTSMVFFCLIILAFSLSRLWQRTFYPLFPSAVRTVAARCKFPFFPPPRPVPRR